jgi:hypothetical protein
MPQIHALYSWALLHAWCLMHGFASFDAYSWHSPGGAFGELAPPTLVPWLKPFWILLGCFFNHGKDPFLSFSSTKVLYVGVRTLNGAVLWIWLPCLTTTSQWTLLPWTTIVLTNVGWFFILFYFILWKIIIQLSKVTKL